MPNTDFSGLTTPDYSIGLAILAHSSTQRSFLPKEDLYYSSNLLFRCLSTRLTLNAITLRNDEIVLYYVEITAVFKPTIPYYLESSLMIARQKLLFIFIAILSLSLVLAGCVRPVPEGEATAVPNEPDISDPNVGGGTSLDPTTAPETDGQLSPTEPAPVTETEAATEEPAVEETAVPPEAAAEETQPAEATPVPTEQTTTEMTTETTAQTTTTAECPKDHVVQPGENLFRVGLQYGLSWVALAQYNGITNPNSITVGQTIKIPCDGTTPPNPPTPPPDNVTYYTVQPGDNLFRIGLRFGVSWVEIAEANGLVNPNQIYAGQVLKIPTSAPGPRPEFTHVVKQGETVYSIAVQYGVTPTAIAEANNLEYPYVIYAGQTLLIPGNG
jgi:LysM repeat protein